MSAPQGRTLRGFLADGDTGAGLGGLRVEVWGANGHGPTLIASGRSDAAGVFRVRVPPAPGGRRVSDVEWRVLDRDTLLLSQTRALPPEDRDEPIDLTVPSLLPDQRHDDAPAPAVPYEIVGRVRGSVPDRSTVRAVLKTLRNQTIEEEIVGEAPVNSTGWYRLVFERPAGSLESIDASVSVRLYSPDGTLIVESVSLRVRQRRLRLDIRPRRPKNGPSEFALLESRLAEGLESGAEALDGAESGVVDQVAEWLDVDPERLEMYQQARALGVRTGVAPAAYYALARSGAGSDLDALLDVSTADLKTTLEEAAAEGIVDAEGLGHVDALVEQLSGRIVDHVMQRSADEGSPGLREVLEAADIPRETIESVIRSYRGRSVTIAEFWESFGAGEGAAEAIGESESTEVRTAVETAALVGVDPPLLESLHALRKAGRWRASDDLADFTFDDWCELIEQLPGAETEAEEEDEQELIEARAEAILDRLEEEYPSRFIFNELNDAEEIDPITRTLLKRTRGHDFRCDSIADRAASDPSLVADLDANEAEVAIEGVAAIERVARFAEDARQVRVLVGTGIVSAAHAAAIPPKQFAHVYGEALGGRPQAARVHAQAQQAAAASKLIALRLLQALQQGPFVLAPPADLKPDIKQVADLRSLFQSAGGFCDCEHCGSVFSPAAYFVDLLRYLNVSTPERLEQLEERFKGKPSASTVFAKLRQFQPLDVLLARRPDLADLPLTCENTLTPLPYIDLVNELLEASVTGGTAAFDTGKTPADVLRAVPQHLSREAYDRLRQSVHPLTLPYHQPLALARAYLGHLGVSRLELLRTLGRGDAMRAAIVAESLGMSPDELAFVVQPPPELWRHFGFDAPDVNGQPFIAALAHVPAFLAATGMTFQSLIDLVSTRFLNADDRLRLETPTADCNPDIIRLEGLDEPRLAGMVRLIRLQRRLGWSWTDLDRALLAFGARDLDVGVLEKLATAQEVAKKLDRPLRELLVLWAPIDTWGADNQFDKLFTTRAVMWRTQDERTFQLRPDRRELAETGESLDPVASALLAALRITSEELALIRALHARRGAAPRLDLAGLSALQRVVVLARALQLRVGALDLLLRLTPPEADPFKPGDPDATRRFIEIVREVQSSDFTPERLAYILRHEAEPRRDPGPLPAQVDAVLATIRRGLADAFSETSRPAEITGDTLRQKLAVLFDPALLDQAMEVLDPRTAATAARRRAFFDRHLARLFPDPAAAAARLFGAAATPAATTAVAPASASAPVAPQEAAPAAPVSPLEARWRANIDFVLEYLLPIVRARQLRGAVVQTLSDTLGVTAPAMARLLDRILRSRSKPGEPLIRDFLALLGTGLTGAYYTSPDLSGQPAVTRVDPDLTFSWAGASPAAGIPNRRFSARWTGHFLPRSKAGHIFYIQTDGAVRLTIKVADAERTLIDQPAPPPGRPAEHASDPVELDPSRLYEIRLEYRNQGEPPTLAVQVGTNPAAKQPLPTPNLYPADGLSSFEPVEQSYRRLHKAALLLSGFGTTDRQLDWLTGDPVYLNLDALPMQAGTDTDAVPLFRRWRQLAALYALRRKLPRSNTDLFDVFAAPTLAESADRLVLATGWDRDIVQAFLGPDGMAIDSPTALRPPIDAGEEPLVLRLASAVDLQRRAGVAPPALYAWANSVPDADAAASIVQAVKARYDETRWLEVARTLNDPLRQERRDALVSYLLPRMRHLGVTNRNQLFEYFLIDVDMNPCMLTSRIRQATGAVQTFFQRCLMNLEPKVPPRIIDDNDWKFLKNYRVFEAAKKVFLYPENWIEPELRDDKSPLFQTLESTILQQEIKRENVEAAFSEYLEGLDEVSRLDVRGVWFEEREAHRMARQVPSVLRFIPEIPASISKWDHGTYHVFARTFNAPHVWYYRRLENGRAWTAWEKLDVDIEGDHLVPVIFNRRMHLFWAMFKEVNKPVPDLNKDQKGPPPKVGKDWEIQLAYSVYDRGKWSRKRMSSGGVVDVQTFVTIGRTANDTTYEGSRGLSPSDYTLRASVTGSEPPTLQVHVYCRATDMVNPGMMRLMSAAVDRVATFTLNGCNGALVPDRARAVSRARVVPLPGIPAFVNASAAFHAAVGTPGPYHAPAYPFQIGSGGVLKAPSGFEVAAMGYATAPHAGALLALPTPPAGALSVALPGRQDRTATMIIPVNDPNPWQARGLYPFFFQDLYRSYFVRPIVIDYVRPPMLRVPVFTRRLFIAPPGPRRPRQGWPALPFIRFAPRRRGARGEIDESLLEFDALDAWEDLQDEAWHPDDAAEARRPRRRRRPAPRRPVRRPPPPIRRRPAPRVVAVRHVPQFVLRHQEAFHAQQLQFVPFEHPDTCRLLATLKAKGIEGLLDFVTTRPLVGIDHFMAPPGIWTQKPRTVFENRYGIGPLLYTKALPHLDVAFEPESAYSVYNWELFFHAPLQVAIRLAKDGRHEEAQRWFHFIFDPTTDSSAPPPRRYWRFAPFYENDEYASARELMQLLGYNGPNPAIIERREKVRQQLSAWWEKPFSPHVIARLRTAAYQKAVVMKYIDNLIEWGDKLFRRDSMESIQEATQLYVLAANILGPRPEKIPPIVSKPPLTFQRMRHALDLFSNFEVRLENLLVRRPFRINANPDRSGASILLGMATQYFCTPPNPQMDKYWDTVADRLFKIRNCMNIQGIVRQLPLFEPPIDPGLLVRAAAAGVDLGSVIASLNAPPPHYRFPFLLGRAVRMAEEIRTFGKMMLQVLERRDAEALASLRASNEVTLLDAVRDIRKRQVRQVEESLNELSLERDHIDLKMQHLNTQLQQLMNPQEEAQQKSLSAAQVISAVSEGVDLVAKVAHAIPEFQTGAAGGFSSPFVTLQLGGQMFGEIASAFSASLEKVVAKNETEADLAAQQAEYQRRREEWQHELELLAKEKTQVEKRIAETQIKLEIASAELRRHDLEVDNSRKVQTYLRDKYTNEQLYGWMLGQVSGSYFLAYKTAFDAAQQSERAFRFERGDPSSSFVQFSYWDSLKKGLFAGERLLVDLRRMESAYVEGDRRLLEITRHVSLREDFPLAFVELTSTGRCQIEITEALLDGDFPGHYFRRVKTVSLTVSGVTRPHRNVNCTLTLLENRIRTDANASGSYAASSDGEDSRFMVNPVPVQAVATSRPDADAGVFHLRFDDDRYLPFEGAGAISTWRIELPQADNALDLSDIGDVVVTLSYTARGGGAALEAAARADRDKGLARGGIKPEPLHAISIRRDQPALWKRLEDAAAGQEVELALPLDANRLSGRYSGLDVRIERATVFAKPRGTLAADLLKIRLDPPKGSGTAVTGWTPPWPRSRTMRGAAEVSGPAGVWKLAVSTSGAKVTDVLDDLVVVFDVRARKS